MLLKNAARKPGKKIALLGILFFIAFLPLFGEEGTRRFGVFIGSNNGGRERVTLRYAISDAQSVSRVFTGMGGITGEDSVFLVEPTVAEINRRLTGLGRQVNQARRNQQRTELVFYYSGHSDENGILLNRENYSYRKLREAINAVEVDMTVVIFDSCSSGAITRAKGGVKTQPFLFDASVSAKGYAFLTSSSATEASQESDHIESSYFTHSLLAGLRGAADSVGDGRVTLNELYRFAYTETLAKTETSRYGAQHPSYDIQISGAGDVVLTDVKEISANLVIAEDLTGRVSIRDSSDFLVAELTKINRKPLVLGLEPGSYRITLQQGNDFYRADITLPENQATSLSMVNFSRIAAATGGLSRGTELSPGEDVPVYPVSFQLIPGFDVLGHRGEKATNNLLFGLLAARGHNLRGLGAATLGLINTGYMYGIQSSGIFNKAYGEVQGIQASGIFNWAGSEVKGIQASGIFNQADGDIWGLQAAGIYNWAKGDVWGIQTAGIFNYAGAGIHGMQSAVIVNYVEGDVQGIQTAGILNRAKNLQGIQAGGILNMNTGGHGAMFGLINYSESENMVPFGLVNIIENGILHPAIYFDDMLFANLSFRSGSKRFYSIVSVGTRADILFNRSRDDLLISRVGFGVEFSVKEKFFFDIDLTNGNIINLDTLKTALDDARDQDDKSSSEVFRSSITNITQLRLTGGYKIRPHLGVFAGVSYDYLYQLESASPHPRDFRGPVIGGTFGRHTHKLGFFAGVQF